MVVADSNVVGANVLVNRHFHHFPFVSVSCPSLLVAFLTTTSIARSWLKRMLLLVDLVVRGSGRVRENIAAALLNLVRSGGDKAVGVVKEVDEAEAIMRTLVDGNSRVSTRGKSKVEVLL